MGSTLILATKPKNGILIKTLFYMEQEQILSELKNKSGLSGENAFDRTLATYVSQNLPADGTEPDDNYWNRHSTIIKSIVGQYSHDVASEVNNFKKSYKPQISQQLEKPAEEKADEIPSWGKTILEKLEAQEKEQKDLNNKKRVDSILSSAIESAKKDGADNEVIVNIIKDSIGISETDTDVTVKEKFISKYNELYTSLYGNGAYPSRGNGGFSNGTNKADEDAYKEHLRQRGKIK